MSVQYGYVLLNRVSGLPVWSTFSPYPPPPSQASQWKYTFRFTVCACNTGCDTEIENTGEHFPQYYYIDLSTSLGYITMLYDNNSTAPIKIQFKYGGVIIFDSGYIGSPSRQAALDAYLYSHGQPSETIIPTFSGSFGFNKGTILPDQAEVVVYSPFSDSDYEFTVGCPTTTTTSTSTSTSTTTTTSTTTSTSTSTSTSTTTTTSTTSSTTTVDPRRNLIFEFANPDGLEVILTDVTVQDSEGTKLWDDEIVNLTSPLTQTRNLPTALLPYQFTMVSGAPLSLEFKIDKQVDGGTITPYEPSAPFGPGDNVNYTGMMNEGAITSIKYIITFTSA